MFCFNDKWYKISVMHEEIENHLPGAIISRSSIFIDDVLVIVISRMKKTILTNRCIDVNLNFKDSFKILKAARKAKEN